MAIACLAAPLCGCADLHSDGKGATAAAAPVSLHQGTMVVLMPAAADADSADRQKLALAFTESLRKLRPDLTVAPLESALTDIGTAGLADSYARLYATYRATGLFDGATLQQVARATGARYLLQLRLDSLQRTNGSGPLAMIGIKKKETMDMRLSVQIWDGADGKLLWQGSSEDSKTKFSLIVPRTVQVSDVALPVAEHLVKQLPL